MTEPMFQLQEVGNSLATRRPTPQDALAITQLAERAIAFARALPPITRNATLKNVADKLEALELLFRKQGAELVDQNRVAISRLHAIAQWGVEYDTLPEKRGSGQNIGSTGGTNVSPKQEAMRRSGDMGKTTASRYSDIGEHWDVLYEEANDAIQDEEVGLKWALRKLMEGGIGGPEWLRIYQVWNFQMPDPAFGLEHPGRIPGQIMQNLNYYYTAPGDLVVDPFAGGGSTIDVCAAHGDDYGNRKCMAFDIEPIRKDIKRWDAVAQGLPVFPHAKMLFLDPPYWRQKRGEYSDHETNLANLPLDRFHDEMERIVRSGLEKADLVALIIGPTQEHWELIDHAAEMMRRIGVPWKRIQVPYSTQQHGGQYVLNAKKEKQWLYLARDLMIWKVTPGQSE